MRGQALAPGFIAAMPQLGDPNFRRTVVLMLRHNEEGAFGLVINRPGDLTVAEFCGNEEIPYAGSTTAPMMVGGPVQTDSHLLVLTQKAPPAGDAAGTDAGELSEVEGEGEGEALVGDGVAVVTSRARLVQLASEGLETFRCYAGYAGWGPLQLESELADGAWVPLPIDARLVFDPVPERVWERALRSAGIDPVTLVPGGEVN